MVPPVVNVSISARTPLFELENVNRQKATPRPSSLHRARRKVEPTGVERSTSRLAYLAATRRSTTTGIPREGAIVAARRTGRMR